MTWLADLDSELSARGFPRRERERILLELGDHLTCDPGGEDRLGDPSELATTFADELATARTRGTAFQTFGALAATAVALVISQLAIGHAGGYPGFRDGISVFLFIPALAGMFIAPQVALVAGSLAALRGIRRRRAQRLPAAELGLIRRRARVALLAGFGTVAGLGLYLADFALRLPGWYEGLVGSLAAIAGLALCLASRNLTHAQTIHSVQPGAAGDIYDDLPVIGWRWLRRRPRRLGGIAALLVGLAATLAQAHAEHSLSEGLQRGITEGLAAAIGFAILGRAVGLLPDQSRGLLASSAPQCTGLEISAGLIRAPGHQLVADEDRIRAEGVLRDGYASGRLSLEELSARLSAVYDAEDLGHLRDALHGLLPDPRG